MESLKHVRVLEIPSSLPELVIRQFFSSEGNGFLEQMIYPYNDDNGQALLIYSDQDVAAKVLEKVSYKVTYQEQEREVFVSSPDLFIFKSCRASVSQVAKLMIGESADTQINTILSSSSVVATHETEGQDITFTAQKDNIFYVEDRIKKLLSTLGYDSGVDKSNDLQETIASDQSVRVFDLDSRVSSEELIKYFSTFTSSLPKLPGGVQGNEALLMCSSTEDAACILEKPLHKIGGKDVIVSSRNVNVFDNCKAEINPVVCEVLGYDSIKPRFKKLTLKGEQEGKTVFITGPWSGVQSLYSILHNYLTTAGYISKNIEEKMSAAGASCSSHEHATAGISQRPPKQVQNKKVNKKQSPQHVSSSSAGKVDLKKASPDNSAAIKVNSSSASDKKTKFASSSLNERLNQSEGNTKKLSSSPQSSLTMTIKNSKGTKSGSASSETKVTSLGHIGKKPSLTDESSKKTRSLEENIIQKKTQNEIKESHACHATGGAGSGSRSEKKVTSSGRVRVISRKPSQTEDISNKTCSIEKNIADSNTQNDIKELYPGLAPGGTARGSRSGMQCSRSTSALVECHYIEVEAKHWKYLSCCGHYIKKIEDEHKVRFLVEAKREGGFYSVMIQSIARGKNHNGSLGHSADDRTQAASELRKCLDSIKGDTASRNVSANTNEPHVKLAIAEIQNLYSDVIVTVRGREVNFYGSRTAVYPAVADFAQMTGCRRA